MDRTKSKRKRELYSILLVILIVGITIGYAALSTNLNINGTSRVSSNSWDIHFNNIQVTSGSVSTPSPDQAATITQNNTTEVTYIVTLSKPGDFYEFTVDAVNAGTVDGMIGTIVSKLNGVVIDSEHPLPVYLDYSLTYSDGTPIADNHLLEAGATETYKVKLEFKRDIENNQLPSTDQSNAFSFSVTYVQRDSNAVTKPSPYKYTVNSTKINIGQAIPNGITQYSTASEAMAAFSNRPFYLKHKIQNGIVTESYVEFVVTEDMASANSGMTAGTYSLRGGIDESDLDSKPIYELNKATLLSAFGSSYCTDYSFRLYCSVSDFSAGVRTGGFVNAGGDGWRCGVYEDVFCGIS